MIIEKLCPGCGLVLPLTAYHKRSNRPLGVRSQCKQCEKPQKKIDGAAYFQSHKTTIYKQRKNDVPRKYMTAYLQDYYQEHRSVILARTKNWGLTHPEERRAQNTASAYKRRARISIGGNHSGKQWTELLDAVDHRCVGCKTHESVSPLQKDHIIPVSRGGMNTIDNIQPLCSPCNQAKATKTICYLVREP